MTQDKGIAAMHREFPHAEELIYLNHAGVGPWPQRSADAVARFAEENAREGARHYARWMAMEQRLREQMAALVGAPSADDIALVKNTSEGLSLVAYGLDWRAGDNVVINRAEFPSNRVVWESLREPFGVEVRDVDLDAAATPEDALIQAMDERTRVLPVSSVQYGTGLRMDLTRLGEACRRHGSLFCVDAIQSVGALRTDVQAIGADFLIADGHKWMLGPEGIGLFYCRPEARAQLRLRQYGWHMVEAVGDYDRPDWSPTPSARRFEPGSPNTLGIYGLSASLSLHLELGMAHVEAGVLDNARYLMARIAAEPRLQGMTPRDPERHAGIVTFRVAGVDNAALYRQLRERGVICASRAGGIRFAPHFYNTTAQLDRAVDLALALARRVDQPRRANANRLK